MIEKIKNLKENLSTLEKEIIDKFNKIDINNIDFQNKLIEIMKNYPEYKDLIKFIIYINDLQNTSNKELEHLYLESISNIIQNKKELLHIMETYIKELEKQKPKKINIDYKNFFSKLTPNFLIMIFITGSIFFLSIFLVLHPSDAKETMKTIVETSKSVKK